MFLAAFIWIKQRRKRMLKTDKTAENKGKQLLSRQRQMNDLTSEYARFGYFLGKIG